MCGLRIPIDGYIFGAAMTDSLLDYVLGKLHEAKGQWGAVSKDTGISKRTIEKISAGEIADPGVRKIEKLGAYFRRRERSVSARAN